MNEYLWTREPFFGGCSYFSDAGHVVAGRYSPADPLEFESDCDHWTLNTRPGEAFPTAAAAMKEAEYPF